MTTERLSNFVLLPELKLLKTHNLHGRGVCLVAQKVSEMEVCPKCATPSRTLYDKRIVRIKDEPIRGKLTIIEVLKRRFLCKPCKKPFTEPISGVGKFKRTTHRLQRAIKWACENFSSLKAVQKAYYCSARMVYTAFYARLEELAKMKSCPIPKKLGIDEHSIRKPKDRGTQYATILVDHTNKRVFDLVEGRNLEDLNKAAAAWVGLDKVEIATLDLSTTFRSFLRTHCPKARLVADRFHVQRLFTKLVNRVRLKITGDKRIALNRILLKDGSKLDWELSREIKSALPLYPDLNEVYQYKEAMHRFYRIKGYKKAQKALTALLDRMARSKMERVLALRKVILNWRHEILNYFLGGHSNGRVEGFNRKAKLLQRKAYGIKSFKNYRLRLLNECS